jgi:hypothetical protein
MTDPRPESRIWRRRARQVRTLLVSLARRAVLAVVPHAVRLSEWAYRYEVMVPASGAQGIAAAMPNFLYRNMLVESGRATFVNANFLLSPGDFGATLGGAWADVDGDGAMDWFVPNRGTPSRLYRNRGPAGHYLRVHVVGDPLRDAVGTWVRIRVGNQAQVRHVHVLDGYLSQSQMDPHFGVGAADTVDEVWVRWPGQTRWELRCTGLAANRAVTITQGRAGCR